MVGASDACATMTVREEPLTVDEARYLLEKASRVRRRRESYRAPLSSEQRRVLESTLRYVVDVGSFKDVPVLGVSHLSKMKGCSS
jgi:DNA-directed RNA polymerase subunit F